MFSYHIMSSHLDAEVHVGNVYLDTKENESLVKERMPRDNQDYQNLEIEGDEVIEGQKDEEG